MIHSRQNSHIQYPDQSCDQEDDPNQSSFRPLQQTEREYAKPPSNTKTQGCDDAAKIGYLIYVRCIQGRSHQRRREGQKYEPRSSHLPVCAFPSLFERTGDFASQKDEKRRNSWKNVAGKFRLRETEE